MSVDSIRVLHDSDASPQIRAGVVPRGGRNDDFESRCKDALEHGGEVVDLEREVPSGGIEEPERRVTRTSASGGSTTPRTRTASRFSSYRDSDRWMSETLIPTWSSTIAIVVALRGGCRAL
jgi:hypothetical protein